jgi:hypothetical protein
VALFPTRRADTDVDEVRDETGTTMTRTTDDDGTVVTRDRAPRQAVVGRAQVDEREAARRREAREAEAAAARVVDSTPAPETVTTDVPVGPRPRASFLAMLSLVIGVVAAAALLTGVLAGPAVAVGLIAVFLGIGGLSATSRRHVAGKSDALLGLALGLGAAVLGTLAVTGNLPWFDGDANHVTQARDWLQAQLPWLFPS